MEYNVCRSIYNDMWPRYGYLCPTCMSAVLLLASKYFNFLLAFKYFGLPDE